MTGLARYPYQGCAPQREGRPAGPKASVGEGAYRDADPNEVCVLTDGVVAAVLQESRHLYPAVAWFAARPKPAPLVVYLPGLKPQRRQPSNSL